MVADLFEVAEFDFTAEREVDEPELFTASLREELLFELDSLADLVACGKADKPATRIRARRRYLFMVY